MVSIPPAPNQNDLVEIINGFNRWLNSKSYQSSTIRNYLSDINAYFKFISNPSVLRTAPLDKRAISTPALSREGAGEGFNPDAVSSYLQTIQKNPAYSRYLSSLSKFFQYALDQNLIKTNPLKQAQKVKKPSVEDVLSNYESFLNKKHFSVSTIRNYLNDIQQFINFCQTNPSEPQ